MPSTGLFGPHPLTYAGVDAAIKGNGAGAYALGDMQGDTFIVRYVGRSDSDLHGRVRDHVPEKYSVFKFGFLSSAKAAFEKECTLYHDFGMTALDNEKHPDCPDDTTLTCPRCPKKKT